MLAVPAAKLPVLMEGIHRFQSQGFNYRRNYYFMQGDFPRPDFYKIMFKEWGLEDY